MRKERHFPDPHRPAKHRPDEPHPRWRRPTSPAARQLPPGKLTDFEGHPPDRTIEGLTWPVDHPNANGRNRRDLAVGRSVRERPESIELRSLVWEVKTPTFPAPAGTRHGR